MDKYKPEAEGALYPRRTTEPATAEGLREIVGGFDPENNAAMVRKMIDNAVAVLRDRFDDRVAFDERFGVVVDGVRTCRGDDNRELVRDAFDVVRVGMDVLDYWQRIPRCKPERMPMMLGVLVRLSVQLGVRHERMRHRDDGHEWEAKVGQDQINKPRKYMTPKAGKVNRKTEAEKIARDYLAANPQVSDKAVRSHVMRELNIGQSQAYGYLPKKTLSQFRK